MTRILNREFDLEAARRLHEEGYLPPVARALSARGISCLLYTSDAADEL